MKKLLLRIMSLLVLSLTLLGCNEQSTQIIQEDIAVSESTNEQSAQTVQEGITVSESTNEQSVQTIQEGITVSESTNEQSAQTIQEGTPVSESTNEQSAQTIQEGTPVSESTNEQSAQIIQEGIAVSKSTNEQSAQTIQEDIPVSESTLDERVGDVMEYGLLSQYNTATRELTYTPIEIIDETDVERIKELEALGVELEFPNGYFIYQPNELHLSFPLDKAVSVALLNNEFTLEKSSIEALAEILEGHPPFFLCKLHIVGGKIIEIEEKFVP